MVDKNALKATHLAKDNLNWGGTFTLTHLKVVLELEGR